MKIKGVLENLYWFFKDFRLAKKISSNPDTYFVYLPFGKDKIFIDFYVKAGALTEGKEKAGIGHLLEHYLAGVIKNKYHGEINIDARINDNYMIFSLAINNTQELKNLNDFIISILEPDFNNKKVFDSEKKSVINELTAEKNNIELNFENLIQKIRYLDEPNKRSFVDHLETLGNLNIEDIKKYHQEIFPRKNLMMFVSSTSFNKKIIDSVVNSINKYVLSDNISVFPKPTYSKANVTKIENNNISGNYIALTFPSFNKKASREDKIVLSFLSKIISSHEQNNGFTKIRETGIYDFSAHYLLGEENGHFWIQSYLKETQIIEWINTTVTFLEIIKRGEINEKQFEQLKNDLIVYEKNYWRSNQGRFNKISNSLLEYGEITSWREIKETITKIGIEDIKKMAETIFEFKDVNLIIYGQKTNLTEQELKEKLLDTSN